MRAQPLMIVWAARMRPEGHRGVSGGWREPNVELMQQVRHRMIVLAAFGLAPPGAALDVAEDGRARVELPLDAGLERYHAETRRLLESILLRNGCRLVETDFLDKRFEPEQGVHFSTAHQVGSCRMAERKADGVVTRNGEVFDYPGLYGSDGGGLPSSVSVNTSLTILANEIGRAS